MDWTTKGRVLLTSVATLTTVGGFLADWNRTHLFNPDWPPHARFHDALTITLGSLLGLCGLYFLVGRRGERSDSDLALGALLPSIFWVAQGASFAFPGPKDSRPSSREGAPRGRRLDQRALLQRVDADADRSGLRGRTSPESLRLGRADGRTVLLSGAIEQTSSPPRGTDDVTNRKDQRPVRRQNQSRRADSNR